MWEHWSFLEPPRLICSLISETLLIILAETHRNHFLFIYVDFLFCSWFLGTPNNSVGVTLPHGLPGGLQKWKVTCNEISVLWGWHRKTQDKKGVKIKSGSLGGSSCLGQEA